MRFTKKITCKIAQKKQVSDYFIVKKVRYKHRFGEGKNRLFNNFLKNRVFHRKNR